MNNKYRKSTIHQYLLTIINKVINLIHKLIQIINNYQILLIFKQYHNKIIYNRIKHGELLHEASKQAGASRKQAEQ